MVALIAMAALAVDIGNGMSVRANLRAVADAAALAGAREIQKGNDTNHANFVAFQYLAGQLGVSVPGTCTASACTAGTYAISPYSVYLGDPSVGQTTGVDVNVTVTQKTAFGGFLGFQTIASTNGARAVAPTLFFQGVGYAVVSLSSSLLLNGGGTTSPSADSDGPVYGFAGYGGNNVPHASKITATVQGASGTCTSGGQAVINHIDGDWGAPNNNVADPLTYVWTPDLTQIPPVALGQVNSAVAPPTSQFDSYEPNVGSTAAVYTASGFPGNAQDVSGNWKPGIYNGVAPNGGTYDGGVYKIVNYSGNFAPGSNATLPSGWAKTGTPNFAAMSQSDGSNAVAFVLDHTDTGNLDLASNTPNLTGIDDLIPQGGSDPTPDPAGTHNMVFWSTTGTSGFSGSVTYPPTISNNIAGITYLPNSAFKANGTSGWSFVGSDYFSTVTIAGGGHNSQLFNFICGLTGILQSPAGAPALIR